MPARTLIKNETLLGAAIATRRYDVLRALTHPSFTYLGQHGNGSVAKSRGEWLRMVESTQTISFVHTTNDVLLFDTSAVVTVEAVWIGRSPGAADQQKLVMSDFWLKRDGRWLLVRRHASTLDPAQGDVPVATADEVLID